MVTYILTQDSQWIIFLFSCTNWLYNQPTKIEKALEEIRKELLKVGVRDARVGDKSITISTYPSFCSVEVFVNKVSQGVITTNSFGNYRITLNGPIKPGDEVELKATKDGYKDGKYWDKIN